jgi:hypothetical protein
LIGPDATTKAIDPGSWEPDVYGEVESPFKLDQGKELQNLKRRTKHLAYGLVGVGVIELVLILTHLGFSPLKEDLEKIKAILQTLFKPEGLRCGNCDKPSLRASAFLEEVRVRQDDVAKALDLEDGSSTINAKIGYSRGLLDGAFIASQ